MKTVVILTLVLTLTALCGNTTAEDLLWDWTQPYEPDTATIFFPPLFFKKTPKYKSWGNLCCNQASFTSAGSMGREVVRPVKAWESPVPAFLHI